MDRRYTKEFTREWILEGQSNSLKLYTYFDQVDWEKRWAILNNDGDCIYSWSDGEHGNNHNFFTAIVEIIAIVKN